MDKQDKILDEMNLPWANSNETLETISNNHFMPLFNPELFEIRSEKERDKGIDHHIEIKKENRYTNFRFVVQLKATDSKEANNDGSISLQLDTSNINYLLNNPMPAFYVLYFKESNSFYYENINEFAKSLNKKDSNWNSQTTHVLRFSKPFNIAAIEEIYQLTLKKGKFQRVINERTIAQSVAVNTGDKILIDANFNITDDAEIRKLIEGIGLEIINEGKWQEVIFVHKKASGNVATSSKYNLVLGIANYYSGNLMESLSFFRTAINHKSELTGDLRNHLLFFETTVKYSIGLISDEDYRKKMEQLEHADNVGLYIKLGKARRNYIESIEGNAKDRYERLVADINEIINHPKASQSIKLNAKCELILFEGYKNNMDYVKSVSVINALEEETGPNLEFRKNAVLRFIASNESWYKNVQELKTEAAESKNYFAYYVATISEVKVSYESEVYMDKVFIVKELPNVPKPDVPDKVPFFERMLERITKAHNYFYHVGHIENTIAALSTKYEILHYLNRIEEADMVINDLQSIIEAYDLSEQRTKLNNLRNDGTTHHQFKIWVDKINEEAIAKTKGYEEERNEMVKMDEEESLVTDKPKKNNLHIHLFPIGYFQFPVEEKKTVYEILNITKEAQENFDRMFEMVIPVANIYYNTISQEGFVDGKLADKGMPSWKNIYRIRKAFYENKFYRFEPRI